MRRPLGGIYVDAASAALGDSILLLPAPPRPMRAALDWTEHGRRWPHPERSRFVEAAGLRWHLQEWPAHGADGTGPTVLLLHGSGGSSHSWAALAPLLAGEGFGLLVPDLPGHAFTSRPDARALTLDGITRAVEGLLEVLEPELELVVGHSAGAAVALELARRRGGGLPVVGVCPSLVAGRESHTGPLHRLLAPGFRSGFAARFAAGVVRHTRSLDGLLKTTGSRVPEPSKHLYRLLTSTPEHVNATLTLFTRWDAHDVERGLPRTDVPTLLLAGGADGWIPLEDVERSVRLLPDARLRVLDGLGHLAHEEAPRLVLPEILDFLGRPRGEPGEGAGRGRGTA